MTTRHHNDGLRKLCDCPRRAWPKCSHAWHFAFKAPRKPRVRLSLDRHVGRHVDSKSEAQTIAADLREAIRDGRFHTETPAVDRLTLKQLGDLFIERYVTTQRPASLDAETQRFEIIRAVRVKTPTGAERAFGAWPIADITTDTIERFREARQGEEGRKVVATNRDLALLRATFNWAIRVGYLERTPFARAGQALVKLQRETARTRRLEGDEETRLLNACSPHLRAVVEGALETGMRRGELLSLQWSQIRWEPRPTIHLPAQKTKAKRDRWIPISTRLRAILELRQRDPAGELHDGQAYVFGTEIGGRVKGIKRAWQTAVLRAHGQTPTYDAHKQLTADARAALGAINLRFHDLRREAGSRWLEGGVPIHIVRDWLGHANVSQTSTYLAGTVTSEHEAMQRFEASRATGAPLPRFVTNSRTGGRKRPSTAVARPN